MNYIITLLCLVAVTYGQTPAQRAQQLVNQLTSAQKFSLLNGIGFTGWNTNYGYYIGNTPAISSPSIPSLNLHDGPQGFRTLVSQQYGQITSWPCSIAVTSTWDANLMYQWGQALGAEHRSKGANVILGPGVNFNRVARGGRNGEYLTGEDPLLGAVMAHNYVTGVQSQKTMAVAKHFVLNNQETNRNSVSSNVDDRTFHEIYLPPFEAAVKAGVASTMCSYNRINGTYSCGHAPTLNDILRDEVGFQGWVMSDWAATHGVWAEEGLDQDMPGSLVDDGNQDYYNPNNLAQVNPDTINQMVYRILLQMITIGAFDSPVCNNGGGCNNYLYSAMATNSAHVALARTIASNGAQLLSNDHTLPLSNLPSGSTIALIGSACDSDYNLNAMTNTWNLGNYYIVGGSGRVINPNTDPIVTGITNRAAKSGYKVVSDKSNNVQSSLQLWASSTVAIVCGATTSTEGNDRNNLLVDQDSFISQLLANKQNRNLPPVVVILSTPGPVLTNWRSNANAIVNMYLAGQQTANAWADVLFGDVNPSGRLPNTFPDSESDTILPCTGSDCNYSEGLFVGYRALVNKTVAFPFGHGLSYSTFSYTWEQMPSTSGCNPGDLVCMKVSIKNNGPFDGSEVPQLYIDYPNVAGEPTGQLRGFTKVAITNGSATSVYFGLNSRHLSIYSSGWNEVHGQYAVYVGASSRDIRLRASFTI